MGSLVLPNLPTGNPHVSKAIALTTQPPELDGWIHLWRSSRYIRYIYLFGCSVIFYFLVILFSIYSGLSGFGHPNLVVSIRLKAAQIENPA